MERVWENRWAGVDDIGIFSRDRSFYAAGPALARTDEFGVCLSAVTAAAFCPAASLDDIQSAFMIAIRRQDMPQPAWDRTRERMTNIRKTWPVIADVCRAAMAGNLADKRNRENPCGTAIPVGFPHG